MLIQGDELSFEEGDLLYVAEGAGGDWLSATIAGKPGLVPANYGPCALFHPSPSTLFGCSRRVRRERPSPAPRGRQEGPHGAVGGLPSEPRSHPASPVPSRIQDWAQVSVNGLDASGSTPLYWASHGGHCGAVERLLREPRLCLDSQNKLGDTALHAAAWKGREAVARALVEAGAATGLRNAEGKRALDLATDPAVRALLARLSQPPPLTSPSRVTNNHH